MVLGTGTTAVGTADTWVGGYFADNGTIAGTAGSAAITTNSGTPNKFTIYGYIFCRLYYAKWNNKSWIS